MKRLILYYSLTGHTHAAAEQLTAQTAATLCEIRTVKPMPTSRFSQIMYGGMLSSFGICPKLANEPPAAEDFDEIILGLPVWAGKCAAPIRTLLKRKELCDKVTAVFTYSGSGDNSGCVRQLRQWLPHLRETVSLTDESNPLSAENDQKWSAFTEAVLAEKEVRS